MKKLTAAFAVLAAALAFGVVRASADNVVFGVNDDAGKYENGGGPFFSTLQGVGMTNNTMTLLWDETAPTTIPDSGFLKASLQAAAASGIDVLYGVRGLAKNMVENAKAAGLADVKFFADSIEAGKFLAGDIREGDLVLVKGSRGVRTERVIEELLEKFELES